MSDHNVTKGKYNITIADLLTSSERLVRMRKDGGGER